MNPELRENLQSMVEKSGVENTTEKIRKLKHSKLIFQDINTILKYKKRFPKSSRKKVFKAVMQKKCKFMFKNYKSIFDES